MIPSPSDDASRACQTTEVFSQLLDRLCLPGSAGEQVRAVLSTLLPDASETYRRSAFQAATALLASATEDQGAQLQALRTTVAALSAELANSLGFLDAAMRPPREALGRRQALEEAIHAELQGLELMSSEVEDMASLRRTLSTTTQGVLGHLRDHAAAQEGETGALLEVLSGLRVRTEEMIQRLQEHKSEASAAAGQRMVDPVTGCPNRLAFAERSGIEWAKWCTNGGALCLAIFGLDGLGEINVRFGHAAADQVLRAVATLAMERTPKRGILCRHGGGEFVAILPGFELADALASADSVRQAIAAFRVHSRGERVPVTLSAGISQFRSGEGVDDAFERAHEALRRAKGQTGNRCLAEQELEC